MKGHVAGEEAPKIKKAALVRHASYRKYYEALSCRAELNAARRSPLGFGIWDLGFGLYLGYAVAALVRALAVAPSVIAERSIVVAV